MLRMMILSLLMMLLASCATIKNGYHVQRQAYKSYGELAKTYGLDEQRLRASNNDQEFKKLNWVFVPRRVGLLGFWQIYQKNKPKEESIANKSSDDKKREAIVEGKNSAPGKLNLIWPVPSVPMISSKYGMRRGRMHHGLDIPAPMGTKIAAAESGKVIYSDSKISGYGRMIIIAHENDYLTVYAHNTKNLFKEGDYVKQGDVIALSGRTGRVTGPHLHFEVRRKDKSIDPLKFLKIPKRKRNIASFKKKSKKKRR